MAATYIELSMDQGATFSTTITLTNDTTNEALNLSGYLIQSQMRYSYYAANASATLNCTIANASTGLVSIGLDAANTANIKPSRYVFDVKTTSPANVVNRVLEGIITVYPQVTK